MFREKDHPRGQPNNKGQFAQKDESESYNDKVVDAVRTYSSDPERDIKYGDMPNIKRSTESASRGRVKVGEITNPIYDDMVLSNGRRVKDIVTRVVEMPLTGPVGAEHIEEHAERKGMVEHYIGFMNTIINDPDYVFEDKTHENTLQIEKKIDAHTIMTVRLNYDNPAYTNTVITMRNESNDRFNFTKRNYENFGKVLYKKEET